MYYGFPISQFICKCFQSVNGLCWTDWEQSRVPTRKQRSDDPPLSSPPTNWEWWSWLSLALAVSGEYPPESGRGNATTHNLRDVPDFFQLIVYLVVRINLPAQRRREELIIRCSQYSKYLHISYNSNARLVTAGSRIIWKSQQHQLSEFEPVEELVIPVFTIN